MGEDLIDFILPENDQGIITVIGVGGGGTNAVNRMFEKGIKDVDFFIANTDAQALSMSNVPRKIQLGETLTEGRGAGNRAETGKQAAIESARKIRDSIKPSTKMAFIVAGMGGGTGTGATPVIAGICRELNILTVGVVTLPFRFEGPLRLKQAIKGINALSKAVDALLIIHNEKLREIYGNLTLSNAFANADKVLMLAVKGIAEIITIHGYVNVDFADVHSVMADGGIAFMGSATARGRNRAREVIDSAINSPLLNNNDIRGAGRVLLNITSGKEEITVDELVSITDTIIEKVQGSVNTIWGTCTDESLEDEIRITLVATGFGEDSIPEYIEQNPPKKERVRLEDKNEGLLFEKNDPEYGSGTARSVDSTHKLDKLADNGQVAETGKPEKKLEALDDASSDIFNEPIEEEGKGDDHEQMGHGENHNSLEKLNSARLKALNYNNTFDPDNIEQMEKIPAFKRKKEAVQPEIFPRDASESRYTMGSKDNRLRANNSYLHDAVD